MSDEIGTLKAVVPTIPPRVRIKRTLGQNSNVFESILWIFLEINVQGSLFMLIRGLVKMHHGFHQIKSPSSVFDDKNTNVESVVVMSYQKIFIFNDEISYSMIDVDNVCVRINPEKVIDLRMSQHQIMQNFKFLPNIKE
jgi:hypothetical protein